MSPSYTLWQPGVASRWVCKGCRDRLRNSASRSLTQQQRSITRNHIHKIATAEEEWNLRKRDIDNGRRKSILEVLEERGFINQIVGTREELNTLLKEKRAGVYAGVDPTAPSLHVGHMVPFMALYWMYIHGYSITMLMGGFTASIGDPIGRLTGRETQSQKLRTANSTAMHQQLKRLALSMERYAESRGYMREWAWRRSLLNNYAWWQKLPMKDFLRTMAVGARIGPMLGRDTVKTRLDSGEGMSLAEFMYPLVQAWDWWELFQRGCQVQIGGADQFGNILAGVETIKYMKKHDPAYLNSIRQSPLLNDQHQKSESGTTTEHATVSHGISTKDPIGFTVPLLTTSAGEKFGKSAGNAMWLDDSMTSSFELYQFFLRSADADVEKYLKLFTFLSMSEIEAIVQEQNKDPSRRVAQHKLASEFIQMVHGPEAAKTAQEQHRALFDKRLSMADIQLQIDRAQNPSLTTTDDGRPLDLHPRINKNAKPLDMHSQGSVSIKLPKSLVIQQPLSRILWSAGLVASRSEGQRLINNKGVYLGGRSGKGGTEPMGDALNFAQVNDPKWSTVEQFLIDDNVLILRTGKWRVKVVTVIPDETFEMEGLSCPGWKEEENEIADVQSVRLQELDLQGEAQFREVSHEQKLAKAEAEEKNIGRRHRTRAFQNATRGV